MEQAVIIKTDGTKSVVEFEVGDSYALISQAVGGWIEVVGLIKRQADLWVNEEGKIDGLPQNPIATSLFMEEYGQTDVIVGNVIITGGTDENGDTLGLTPEQVDNFINYDREIWKLGF
jgi:hypothetical protein